MTRRLVAIFVVAAACQLGDVAPLASQERRAVTRTPDQLIAAFVRDAGASGPPSEGTVDLMSVLLDDSGYQYSIEQVLDQLEQIALNASSAHLRAKAVTSLSQAGSRRAKRPRAGNVARLERIYSQTSDGVVKAVVLATAGRAAERPTVLAFLERVAVRPSQDYPGSALDALAAIASHEEQGSSLLRRLHQSRVVHDPDARRWLDEVARRGYQVR